MRLRLIRCK